MRAIDKLAWVRIENGRLLAARSRGKNVFYLPGGKREPGESDETALAREVREELTVTLRAGTVRHLHTLEAQAHGRPEGISVRLTCFTGDYDGRLRPAAEIEEIAWLTWADRPRLSLAGQLLLDWLRGEGLLT